MARYTKYMHNDIGIYAGSLKVNVMDICYPGWGPLTISWNPD